MKTVKQFSIPFTGLKPGKHDFTFEIDDAFFNEFEYSLVKSGNIKLLLEFDKQQELMFILHFHFSGSVKLVCERCLDEYVYPLEANERLIVRTGEEEFDDAEIMTISRHAHEIDISSLVYEYINLALPLIHQHLADENGEPGCNNDTAAVLKKLSEQLAEHGGTAIGEYAVEDYKIEKEIDPTSPIDPIDQDGVQRDLGVQGNLDPRWAALKNIKNN